MIRINKESVMRIGMSILVCLIVVTTVVTAQNTNSGPVSVVATVLPTRIIVVDSNFVIQKIISNTSEDVRPIVVLNSQDGKELPYSDSIRSQYESIKNSANFDRPGVVYEKKTNKIAELFQNFYKSIRKVFGF